MTPPSSLHGPSGGDPAHVTNCDPLPPPLLLLPVAHLLPTAGRQGLLIALHGCHSTLELLLAGCDPLILQRHTETPPHTQNMRRKLASQRHLTQPDTRINHLACSLCLVQDKGGFTTVLLDPRLLVLGCAPRGGKPPSGIVERLARGGVEYTLSSGRIREGWWPRKEASYDVMGREGRRRIHPGFRRISPSFSLLTIVLCHLCTIFHCCGKRELS